MQDQAEQLLFFPPADAQFLPLTAAYVVKIGRCGNIRRPSLSGMSNGNLHGLLGEQIHLWDAICALFLQIHSNASPPPLPGRREGGGRGGKEGGGEEEGGGLQAASSAQAEAASHIGEFSGCAARYIPDEW